MCDEFAGNDVSPMLLNLLILEIGTTHSRAFILRQNELVGSVVREIGAKDTALLGSNTSLQENLGEMIIELNKKASMTESALDAVFAIGMASSNLGLLYIPHCVAPAGADEIAHAIVCKRFPDICHLPVHLVTGVRNAGEFEDLSSLWQMDFMRSEEIKSIGIVKSGIVRAPVNILFLSSHTKAVSVNSQCKITGSLTTMSGQLLRAIIRETFIADSVCEIGWESLIFNNDIVWEGVKFVERWGLTRALMVPRFMQVFLPLTEEDRSSFLEGILIGSDLCALRSARELELHLRKGMVIIGNEGRCKAYKQAMTRANLCESNKMLIIDDPSEIDRITAEGVLMIVQTYFKSHKIVENSIRKGGVNG